MKTTMEKKETVTQQWWVVDADGQTVGRLATCLATVLMGKHKPNYTPHVDCGDFIVVENADKVRFTGDLIANDNPYYTHRLDRKEYQHYTGYPSGRRVITGGEMLKKHPEKILQEAVRRMLPKSKLGRKMLSKLKLYTRGQSHPHQAQQPQPMPQYLLPKSK